MAAELHTDLSIAAQLVELRARHDDLLARYEDVDRKYRSLCALVRSGCHSYLDTLEEFDAEGSGRRLRPVADGSASAGC